MTDSPKCPHCGSLNVKRSRSRNTVERALKGIYFKAYRCRDCNWRGILRSSLRNRTATNTRDMVRSISMIVAVLLAFVVAIILARYLS